MSTKRPRCYPGPEGFTPEDRYWIEERAGILEFLAHVPHKHAEREAYLLWVEMRKREEQEEEGTENGA